MHKNVALIFFSDYSMLQFMSRNEKVIVAVVSRDKIP